MNIHKCHHSPPLEAGGELEHVTTVEHMSLALPAPSPQLHRYRFRSPPPRELKLNLLAVTMFNITFPQSILQTDQIWSA